MPECSKDGTVNDMTPIGPTFSATGRNLDIKHEEEGQEALVCTCSMFRQVKDYIKSGRTIL